MAEEKQQKSQEKKPQKSKPQKKVDSKDKLLTFFEKLSKREKMLVYVAGFFVLLVILDQMVLIPIINRLKNLEDQIAQEISIVRDGVSVLSYKERIVSEYDKVKRYISDQAGTKEEELASLLKKVENLAVNSQVRLISINPTGNIEESKMYTKYEIKLECEGTIEKMVEFIHSISYLEELIKIEQFDLSKAGKDTEVIKCNMLISKILVTI